MTRWKARAEFLLSAIELLFLSLTVEALHSACSESDVRRRARPGAVAAVPARPRRRPEVYATADGPREADLTARRRCVGHKTPHNVTSHRLRRAAWHFGPFPAS